MRRLLILSLLFFLPLQASEEEDQLHVIFGSSGYVLYKVLDFANDHGFRYIKILSYEFFGFDLNVTGICKGDPNGGRFFELEDENSRISFVCFKEAPDDPLIIDLEKYRSILGDVEFEE